MESIKNLAIDTAESSAAFKRRFMWRLLAVLIGGMLLDGYILGIIGPVTGPMKEELGMSTSTLPVAKSGETAVPVGGTIVAAVAASAQLRARTATAQRKTLW